MKRTKQLRSAALVFLIFATGAAAWIVFDAPTAPVIAPTPAQPVELLATVAPLEAPSPAPRGEQPPPPVEVPVVVEPARTADAPPQPSTEMRGMPVYAKASRPDPNTRVPLLIVHTNPPRMIVKADGRVLGQSPLIHPWPRDRTSLRVEVSRDGWTTTVRTATADSNGRAYVSVNALPTGR